MNKNDFVSKLQGVINQGDDFKVLIYFDSIGESVPL